MLPLTELERQALTRRPDLASAAVEERRADTETDSPTSRPVSQYHDRRRLQEKSEREFSRLRTDDPSEDLQSERRRDRQSPGRTGTRGTSGNSNEETRSCSISEKPTTPFRSTVNELAYVEKESIRKADEARQILTAAYRLGGTDLINLLDSERAFRETRRLYHQALYDYRITLYELGSAIGLEVQ